jgi:matrix metalloproteinase-20 (enamelysin)
MHNFLGLAAILLCGMLMTRHQLVYGHEHKAAKGSPSPCLWCQNAPEQKDDDDRGHKTPQALEALRAYLEQYGYLDADRGGTSPLLQEMGDAIGLLQESMGLPETKDLDAVTYAAVGEPRCGHPDYVHRRRHSKPPRKLASVHVINAGALLPEGSESKTTTAMSYQGNHVTGGDSAVATEFAYFSGNPRWNSRLELTWALSTTRVTQRLSRDDIRSAFLHAFQLWAATVPTFRFTEVQDYEAADVKISFVAGEHGDAQNFDGVLGIIAHAFSPEDGRVHFDDAEFWSVDVGSDKAPQALDLTSVAIHEVGHVIGLAHSPVRKSVMFPSIAPHHTKRDLSEDDVQGVRQLYGLDLVPAPSPHLVVDRANILSLSRTFLTLHLFLDLMILMGEHMLH